MNIYINGRPVNGLYQPKMIGAMKNTANQPRVRGKHTHKIYKNRKKEIYRLVGTKLNRHGYFYIHFICICVYILRNNRIKK